ncbi:MAG: hypothetical protein LBV09_06275 [Deferribacteraceae bacterium]|jgi:hypothetical protein|nr:hypothetical protein [Deferribacteraceae bacterium]
MLAGLTAAAAALNNGQGLAAINRNNLNAPTISRNEGANRRSPVFEMAPRGEPRSRMAPADPLGYSYSHKGEFHKDYNGDIVDPTGGVLFNGTPEGISVSEDGVIYEYDDPIGKIDLYDGVGSAIGISTQSVIDRKIGLSDLFSANNTINSIIEQRAFQANSAVIQTNSNMLGTILNMRA